MFRRELKEAKVAAALAAFCSDTEAGMFFVSPVPTAAFEKARQLARGRSARLGVRAIDVLHVASALALGARTFLTFHRTQEKLARAEGLKTL